MSAPLNIGQVLKARARLAPDAMGVRDLRREMTLRQWNARSCRLANALLGLGLKKGDRFAVLAYNRIEWAEAYMAAAKAGLVAVPINFRLTGNEIAYILADVEASAILVEDAFIESVESVRDEFSIDEDCFLQLDDSRRAAGYRQYEDFLAAASDREPGTVVLPDDAWCILYTSGTTGRPKGAIRNHGSTVRLALMTGIELSIVRDDDALLVMPMCHANSLYFFASFLYCGAAVSIFSRKSFDPELFLKTMGTRSNTFTSLVPTHYSMLLDASVDAGVRGGFERVAKLMISSSPARVQTKRAVMEMFPNSGLFELYGSTEAGWVTMLHPDEQFHKPGTVGREVVGSEPVELVGEDGHEVPDGEPGELFSAGPCNFSGYWRLPEKTAEAFRGNHLSVGDMAVRDSDGYIRLVDRKSNMIITGGENVYPSEVESVLVSHPDVQDVAVVGKPDPRWGESVHAVVVPRPGATLSHDDLVAWSRGRLAGYKRPRHVTFIGADEMPRSATGKILHHALRLRLNHPAPNDRSGQHPEKTS